MIALGDQLLRHLLDRVLRARDGESVSRNDDHALGVAQQERDVLGRARLDLLLFRRGRRAFGSPEPAEDHADERAVHRLAHDVGQDRARRSDERSRDDEQRVVQREADAGRRPPGVAVQHRDHDRHVRAADRNDDQHAQHEGDHGHHDERHPVRARPRGDERDAEADHHDREDQVEQVLALEHDRRAREQPQHLAEPGELAERNHRPRERHRADECADEQLDPVAGRNRILNAEGAGIVDHRDGDEHRGQADQRMHGRDELRHLRHLDALGDQPADDAADGQRSQRQIDTAGDEQRCGDRDGHAGDAEAVAAARRERAGEAFEGEDEEHTRHEVDQGNQIWGQASRSTLPALRLSS